MNRRQLVFIVLLNACVSLAMAVLVVWIADLRRPDAEELAAQYTPPPPVVLIVTPTTGVDLVAAPTPTPASVDLLPTPTPVSAAASEPEVYVVQQGDSLFVIALRYNLTVDQLMQANNLTNPDYVFSGQRLVIPSPGGTTTAGATAIPAAPGGDLSLQVQQPNTLDAEQVLIVNEGNSAINLQGWTLGGDVNGPVYAFGDLPLFPGSSVRLHTRSGQNDSLNLYWSRSSPVWSAGAVVRLFNADGREAASYTVP